MDEHPGQWLGDAVGRVVSVPVRQVDSWQEIGGHISMIGMSLRDIPLTQSTLLSNYLSPSQTAV